MNCVLSGNVATYGGGSAYGVLSNCFVVGNRATTSGGGDRESVSVNCLLQGNSANYGGGTQWGTLRNCAVIDNTAYILGGGTYGAYVYNGIVFFNSAPSGANYASCAITFSCATPLPEGAGNMDEDPRIVCLFNPRLLPGSPCINAGTNEDWMAGATDLAGRGRISNGLVDMGPYEWHAAALTGAITVAILPEWTNAAAGFPILFEADIQGDVQGYTWNWDDGQSTANVYRVEHAFANGGVFDVVLTASNLDSSAAATVTVTVIENPIYYVAPGGSNVPPFMDWTRAATTLQAAVDEAIPGSLVLVSNGVYASGGRTNYPALSALTNRVALHRPVTMRSVNGPSETFIVGNRDAAVNGPAAVRCVYLGRGAALVGFTLTNGATLAAGDVARDQSGGGLWCETSALAVSNCVLIGNNARVSGGGAYAGVFQNCLFSANVASNGGGAYQSALTDCRLERNTARGQGGGAYQGVLSGCMVTGNVAALFGGGVSQATLSNCVLASNGSRNLGGGAYNSALVDCTLAGNIASNSNGGGSSGGTASNCLYIGNRSVSSGGGANGGTLVNCAFSNNTAVANGGGAVSATLRDCILSGNSANNGGGAYESTLDRCQVASNSAATYGGGAGSSTVQDSVLTGNRAKEGGGAYYGTWHRCTLSGNAATNGGGGSRALLYNCVLVGNTGVLGGGAYMGNLENCTVAGNTGFDGGGTYSSAATNSVIYHNRATINSNYAHGTRISSSCTAPLIADANCLSEDPRLLSFGHPRLLPDSPCINTGTNKEWMDTATDWLGRPRIAGGTVDMGACEYDAGGFTGSLTVACSANWTNVSVGFPVTFLADIQGDAQGFAWTWDDGGTTSNRAIASHAYGSTGVYHIILRATNQTDFAAATVTVRVVDMTMYVALEGSHTEPFASWANAATTLQAAVDLGVPGALIRVTNGVYETGGRTNYPSGTTLSNRVAVHTPVTIRSMNGPEVTIIRGARDPKTNGAAAVRCVYLVEQAVLDGFTLTGGAVASNGVAETAQSGGGAWCEGVGAVLSNCVIRDNVAGRYGGGLFGGRCVNSTIASNQVPFIYYGGGAAMAQLEYCTVEENQAEFGGGAYRGTLHNCLLTGNTARAEGGGAYDATLYSSVLIHNYANNGGGSCNSDLFNCTIVANTASNQAGGVFYDTLLNCIVYHNKARAFPNYNDSTFSNCCTVPLPMGTGSTDQDPLLVSLEEPRVLSSSPCVDRGTHQDWMNDAADRDGRARIQNAMVDLGAYETSAGAPTGALTVAFSVDYSTVAVGYPVQVLADVRGWAQGFRWLWGDGASSNNALMASHHYTTTGAYDIVLLASNATGSASATATVQVVAQPVHYVSLSGSHLAPYGSWANAATTIQAAVDAATVNGALVLVTNGLYESGTNNAAGGMPARVGVQKPILVLSVNGPEVTVIRGRGPVGATAIRGVYLGDGARLEGFTIVSGCTFAAMNGGGVYGATPGAVVSNCAITACASGNKGAGVYGGTVFNSLLAGNTAGDDGGGAHSATLYDSRLLGNIGDDGGGAYDSTLYRCVVTGNTATASNGGGVYNGILWNCRLTDNLALGTGGGSCRATLFNCVVGNNRSRNYGGGVYEGALYGCTVTGNESDYAAGGAYFADLENCILYFNKAPRYENYLSGSFTYTCTDPLPSRAGNINVSPGILCYGNPRLLAGSPCIDQGSAQAWMAGVQDLAGRGRIQGPAPDLGAFEYYTGSQTGALSVSVWARWTNVAVRWPAPFRADIEGDGMGLVWNWGDGTTETNHPAPTHAFQSAGLYPVVLRVTNLSGSASATVVVQVVDQPVHYVSLAGGHVPPYASWLNAATTIQAAVDAVALPGSLVLVTNGTYQTGTRNGYPSGMVLRARVSIDKPAIVASVNGPADTIIKGQGPIGDSAVRGVVMGPEAVLAGFTVTTGATRQISWSETEATGAGIWCVNGGAIISNCVIANNRANAYAAGAYLGTFYNCLFASNTVLYGDAVVAHATLYDCTLMRGAATSGGGTYYSVQERCRFFGNNALRGGGIYRGEARNCLLYGNGSSQTLQGGGSYNAVLIGCTLVGNMASNGGGAYMGALVDSISYHNYARDGVTSNLANVASTSIAFSCAAPDPGGAGNTASDPRFYKPGSGWGLTYVPGIYQLRPESPCINTGTNYSWMSGGKDLDGLDRILDGTVDMGAFESTPYGFDRDGDGLADWWEMEYFDSFTVALPGDDQDSDLLPNLGEYGLRTSPFTNDTDGDRFEDYHEFLAGTQGTNSSSYLGLDRMTRGGTAGVVVHWQSVNGKSYTLSRAPNLPLGVWTPIWTNIAGVPPINTVTDTTAVGSGPWSYRVELE